MNNLFIQFYGKWKVSDDFSCWGISNGFSDTYDLCKNKGDFLWIQHEDDSQVSSLDSIMKDCREKELPIKTGNVFISATTTTHQYQSYVWAKRYPNINFIVGGPAVITKTSILTDNIPNNLIFTSNSVEQWFNVPDFSYKWKLKLPKKILESNLYAYPCYTITNNCYWGKCIFCKYNVDSIRTRKNFDFEFKNYADKIRSIFLYSPTMSLKTLKQIIINLPKNLKYSMFLRVGKSENKILKEVFELCKNGDGPPVKNIRFQVGVEFPGNRMLQFMKKGTTTNTILEALNIVKEYNAKYYLSFMLGWPNLIKQDLYEVENFVKRAPRFVENQKDPVILSRIWLLLMRVRTPLYNMFEKGSDIKIGPFYIGNTPILSKEQIHLNNHVRDMILSLNYSTLDIYTKRIKKRLKNKHLE